jgi:alkylation response protein AidB-like acyl-CoA dehydrogenase
MKHAMRRSTFGKKLIEHPVIRFKLAQMARQVEASHAWLEYITSVEMLQVGSLSNNLCALAHAVVCVRLPLPLGTS